MQTKMLAAAAVLSGASALNLEASTTLLAQDKSTKISVAGGVSTVCHSTYGYECLQEKIDNTFGAIQSGIQESADADLRAAQDLKADMLRDLKDQRYDAERDLTEMRVDLTRSIEL